MKSTKKYKVMVNPPEISDQELEKYKDFNAILHKSIHAKKWTQARRIALFSVGLALIVAAFLVLGRKQEHTASGSSDQHSKPVVKSKPASASVQDDAFYKQQDRVSQDVTPKSKGKDNSTTKNKGTKVTHAPFSDSFSEAQPQKGYPALFEFFQQHLIYPEQARKEETEGTVMVEFYINAEGKAEQIEILQGINPLLDAEAKRLISIMPPWRPANIDGNLVSIRQTLPINFKLK